MGPANRLIITATGFPGTNKTWRFMYEAFREPFEALASLLVKDETVIISGCVVGEGVITPGFICTGGSIYYFIGGPIPEVEVGNPLSVVIATETENVEYDVDLDEDDERDVLPAYERKYIRYAAEGPGVSIGLITSFKRLKTILELSQFTLPEGIVIDSTYIKLTQAMINYWDGKISNVRANWSMDIPSDQSYIQNRPFKSLAFTYGTQAVSNATPGQHYNDFSKNFVHVYPPAGYTINNLVGFIPSIAFIHYSGDVDGNDRLFCKYMVNTTNNRITVICANTEFTSSNVPRINWTAIWKK
jgi:hypothetical protein